MRLTKKTKNSLFIIKKPEEPKHSFTKGYYINNLKLVKNETLYYALRRQDASQKIEETINRIKPRRPSKNEFRKSHQKLKDSTTFVNISIIYDYACTKIHCNGSTPWSKHCAFGLDGQWPITFICQNFHSGDITICIYSRTFCPIFSSGGGPVFLVIGDWGQK